MKVSYGSTVYVNLEGQTGQALGMALALGKAFFSIGMDLGLLLSEQLLRLFTTTLDILPEWETLGLFFGGNHWHWHWEGKGFWDSLGIPSLNYYSARSLSLEKNFGVDSIQPQSRMLYRCFIYVF